MVFWYENGELNGVQFVFFDIWPDLKPEYNFKSLGIIFIYYVYSLVWSPIQYTLINDIFADSFI